MKLGTTVFLVEAEWEDVGGCTWIAAAYFTAARAEQAAVDFSNRDRVDHQRRDYMGHDVIYRTSSIQVHGKVPKIPKRKRGLALPPKAVSEAINEERQEKAA